MDNFNMYQSYRTAFESLDGEQCKELIIALFDHAAGHDERELGPAPQMAYLFITSQMDRDRAAYERKCEKNRVIAENREAKKRQAKGTNERAPSSTNVHERHQYKDKDNYKDKDKDNRDISPQTPTGGESDDAGESLVVQTATGAAKAASPSKTPQDNPLFSEFWQAYPRKVAKDAARKAWDKRKPDEALLKVMLAAIALQKGSRQWLEENGRFIPHPATWLNKGQWQDEPEPPPSGPNTQGPANPFLRADL